MLRKRCASVGADTDHYFSYNLGELRQSRVVDVPSSQPSRPVSRRTSLPITPQAVRAAAKRRFSDKLAGILPTDMNKTESAISIQSYVTIVEDLVLRLQVNVALAKGFQDLDLPTPKPSRKQRFLSAFGVVDIDEGPSKKYIDMWPIQMSAEIAAAGDDFTKKNALTTNFDTYTLILQLGCILNTVPSWKRTYTLRVCVFVEYESDVEEERGRVETLLRNLRIQAEVLVFWLASGDLKMYNVITNGSTTDDCEQARSDVNDTLRDEQWWQDILRLRDPGGKMTPRQEMAQTEDLLNAVNNWPTASFQHGRRDSKPKRFAKLKRVLRRRHKSSIADLAEAGLTLGMRSQRLPAELLSDSESSSSEDFDDNEHDNGQNNDEAIATESEATTEDRTSYDPDASSTEEEEDSDQATTRRRRAKSVGTGTMNMSIPFINRTLNLRKSLFKRDDDTPKESRPTRDSVTPLKPHQHATASDTALLGTRDLEKDTSKDPTPSPSMAGTEPGSSTGAGPIRPKPTRTQSIPKFTSNPMPRTGVAPEETAGPSIMFVDSPSPGTAHKPDPLSIYNQPATQATGYPISSALPLSFNDLPCRAQHLILNELMRQNSEDTAVLFTTLPSPMEGVCESEAESVQFISDLEILTLGLPPCLLVHSNSMTVTMNL